MSSRSKEDGVPLADLTTASDLTPPSLPAGQIPESGFLTMPLSSSAPPASTETDTIPPSTISQTPDVESRALKLELVGRPPTPKSDDGAFITTTPKPIPDPSISKPPLERVPTIDPDSAEEVEAPCWCKCCCLCICCATLCFACLRCPWCRCK